MLEAILVLSMIMIALSVGLLLLKFVFTMVLLPFKLLAFMTKGLLGLVFVLPVLLVAGVFVLALPVTILLLALPVVILGGVVCNLAT